MCYIHSSIILVAPGTCIGSNSLAFSAELASALIEDVRWQPLREGETKAEEEPDVGKNEE